MFTNLLASARELRFPLTIGYAALLTVWILCGEELSAAARQNDLGLRLLTALDSLGSAALIGIITFIAAMTGSFLWNCGLQGLVRLITSMAGYPKWSELIESARETSRNYGEYQVVTYKGQRGDRPYSVDMTHTVPSATWATYLYEKAQDYERKSSEMNFRVTLALALIPVTLAFGIEGSGLWWLSLVSIPAVLIDLTLLKHTNLRTIIPLQIRDLEEKLQQVESLISDRGSLSDLYSRGDIGAADLIREIEKLQFEADSLREEIKSLNKQLNLRRTKVVALLGGSPLRAQSDE